MFWNSCRGKADFLKKENKSSTSVKCGGVVNVCGYEGRLGLSANGVVPHSPDTALKEIFHRRSKLAQTERYSGIVSCGEPVC